MLHINSMIIVFVVITISVRFLHFQGRGSYTLLLFWVMGDPKASAGL